MVKSNANAWSNGVQFPTQEHRACEEAIAKLATMPLLYRVGEVVRAITSQYPSPERAEHMSKAEIEAFHKLLIAQETLQADEAERRARALKAWGDDQLADDVRVGRSNAQKR